MPSPLHESLVELFRSCGALVESLVRPLVPFLPEQLTPTVASTDLSHAASVEYRADQVTVLRSSSGAPVLAVVVEVQLHRDSRKRRSWPGYVAQAASAFSCLAMLLVIAPDPGVARWAARKIPVGYPGFELHPCVVSYQDIPRILDRDLALRTPELAVLSALANPEAPVAELALTAIEQLAEERATLYFDLIWQALPTAARHLLEDSMNLDRYQSDFARKYVAQGIEQGRAQGIEQGRAQGIEQGIAQLRRLVLDLAAAKLGAPPEGLEHRLGHLHDLSAFTTLIAELGRATDAQAARRALDAV